MEWGSSIWQPCLYQGKGEQWLIACLLQLSASRNLFLSTSNQSTEVGNHQVLVEGGFGKEQIRHSFSFKRSIQEPLGPQRPPYWVHRSVGNIQRAVPTPSSLQLVPYGLLSPAASSDREYTQKTGHCLWARDRAQSQFITPLSGKQKIEASSSQPGDF